MGQIADDQSNLDWLASFDWITPLAQWFNEARGMVAVYGTTADMKMLNKAGIKCHIPMVEPSTGMYLWQLTKADYQKAHRRGML